MKISTSLIDVAILCGGKGTRLQEVINDRPKPMAEINGQPFLDFLVQQVACYGFRRFILCAGYKSTYIADYFKKQKNELTFVISEESFQMGTAGALANAKHLFKSNPVLVLNGDSYCPANLHQFLEFHTIKQAVGSIVLSSLKNPKNFGAITINQQGQITRFNEKPQSTKSDTVNAGIYALDKDAIADIPAGHFMSLETELFPSLIQKGGVFGFPSKEELIDIGTPEQLEKAKKIFN